MFKFQIKYFVCAVLLFFVEVAIALYVHDHIIRPYIGDLLVVILLYCFAHSFLNISAWLLALGVLLFSYFVEFSQYLHMVELIGLQKSRLANIVMGNSFAWIDIVAYTAGIVIVLLIEKKRGKK